MMIVMELGRAPGPWLATALAAANLADVPGLHIDDAGVASVDAAAPSDQVAALRTALAAIDQDAAPTAATDPSALIAVEGGAQIGLLDAIIAAGISGEGVSVGPSGVTLAADVEPQRVTAIEAVVAAYDPAAPANARADEIAAVTADRDRRLSEGYADAVTGKTFQADPASRANLSGLGSAALALIVLGQGTSPLQIIPADNDTITLPATEMLALLQGRFFPWVAGHFTHANDLKQQIRAGEHPDTSAGWPS